MAPTLSVSPEFNVWELKTLTAGMDDSIFGTVLYARAAFNAGINIGCGGFVVNNFENVRGTHVFANSSPCAFIVVNFEGEITLFILVCLDCHNDLTPLAKEQ